MATSIPLRGQVFLADIPDIGKKPVVIVSNNQRNRALGDILGARVTTAPKPELPTIVELGHDDAPLAGKVLCDDIASIPKPWLGRSPRGALSPSTMKRVEAGLLLALDIRP